MVMARLFGAGQVYDAFLLGFRIPNLTRDLFAEGALSSAFVPIFTRVLQKEGRPRAARLANLVATALMVIVGLFCLLGMVFSPALVRLLAPGFSAIPGKHELAVSLTRLMFPFLLLVALAAQAMGILNSVGRFGMPALASSFFNVGSVIAGLTLGFWLGPRVGIPPIYGMAWGVLIGGALQLICQAPSLVRAGFVFRPRLDASDPDLREVLWLMAPAILGNAAVQVNVMVNTNFASAITDAAGLVINGPVSWLSYAFRFMQLPLGLFGVAIASATLPAISRSAASANLAEFRTILSRSLGLVLLLTIPSSLGLVVLGEPMIGAIFQHRAFHAADTIQTARALSFYAIGLGRIRSCQGACAGLLCPGGFANADADQPGFDRRQLFHLAHHGPASQHGPRRAGPVDVGRGLVRIPGAVVPHPAAAGRHRRTPAGLERRPDRGRRSAHDRRGGSLHARNARVAGSLDPGEDRRPGGLDSVGRRRFPPLLPALPGARNRRLPPRPSGAFPSRVTGKRRRPGPCMLNFSYRCITI